MQQPEVFSLGGIVFDAVRFEVPDDLELAKTTLGGSVDIPQTDSTAATRATQTLGVVCDQIQFEAWFLGPDAEQRAQALEALQLAQTAYPFQRGARSYDVTIFHVVLKYHSANEIIYGVVLQPIGETTADSGATSASAADQVSSAGDALASLIVTAPADPKLGPAIESSDSVLADLSTLDGGVGVGLNGIAIQSSDILLNILAAIDLFEAVIAEYAGSTDIASVNSYLFAKQMVGGLSILSSALGSLTGAGSPTISTNGMDLYTIATRYTGDIGNADAIAAVNGISDPFNPPAQIQLPSF